MSRNSSKHILACSELDRIATIGHSFHGIGISLCAQGAVRAPGECQRVGWAILHSDRLDSWKAIADYLGYSQRTVMRWRSERNLPVHQFPGKLRSAVFAYRSELDAWRNGQSGVAPDSVAPVVQSAVSSEPPQSLHEKAQHLWAMRSVETLGEILECFRAAIREDWTNASSYAGLACSLLVSSVCNQIQGSIALLQARAAAERALTLAPGLPEAQCAEAWITFWQLREHRAAARSFQEVLARDPDCSFAATGQAWVSVVLGERERATAFVESLLQKGSFSPYSTAVACRIFFLTGQFRKVLHIAGQANASRSAGRLVRTVEALSFLMTGDAETAIQSLQNESYACPMDPMIAGSLGYAYGAAGDRDKALGAYLVLQKMIEQQICGCAYPLAVTAVALGREEEALNWLEQSFHEQAFATLTLGIDPLLAALRGNPRFDRLICMTQTSAPAIPLSPIFPESARGVSES